jgi:hypothetical protein
VTRPFEAEVDAAVAQAVEALIDWPLTLMTLALVAGIIWGFHSLIRWLGEE